MAATLAGESGYVCYRSFAAAPSYLERNPDTAQRFVNGYGRARRWVAESAAAAVAECIVGVFPDYSHDVLAESVRRCQTAGVWAAGPRVGRQGYDREVGRRDYGSMPAAGPQIGRQGYDRMRAALIAGGLGWGCHPCESIVRPQFAERAGSVSF